MKPTTSRSRNSSMRQAAFCEPPVKRPNYFTGQILSADDFTAEQEYQGKATAPQFALSRIWRGPGAEGFNCKEKCRLDCCHRTRFRDRPVRQRNSTLHEGDISFVPITDGDPGRNPIL